MNSNALVRQEIRGVTAGLDFMNCYTAQSGLETKIKRDRLQLDKMRTAMIPGLNRDWCNSRVVVKYVRVIYY
jgi:hypothetical protein